VATSAIKGALQALSDRQAGSEEMADLEQEELIADFRRPRVDGHFGEAHSC
jgi:hypothetical protein